MEIDMDVILLDSQFKSGLACARSLGSKGIRVGITFEDYPNLSYASRYTKKVLYSNGKNDGDISRNLKDRCMLFPMTDISMIRCFEDRKKGKSKFVLPFSSYEAYKKLSNKSDLFRMAQELGISCPKTFFSPGKSVDPDFEKLLSQITFPVVLKPSLSRILTSEGWVNTGVKYSKSQDEFRLVTSKFPFNSYPFLIQERIQGPGTGIFLLTENGQVKAFFAHRRIREKPPSGGVSVVCESIEPPKEALDAAKILFEYVGWTGVGMVEFKMDKRDNRPKLMEVNARFWGSLQLAISAGVDFPYLLYKMALGKDCQGPDSYKIGLRSRWELGDLDHLLIRLKNKSNTLSLPEHAPSKTQVLFEFCLDFFRPSVKNEIFRWNDPKPFIYELKQYLLDLQR
jgi:predicted ATP-grasp superfamily ATP-dependent carboligase